ncbi:MAG: anti-sigma factor family protein [Candidatus Brachytrichaceae bacterium NZ_4S206]|jgi:anti-sigma factor RsiW
MNVEELMIQALDGEISPQDRAKLDAYLAERPDERAEFERMLAVNAALHRAPVIAPPDGFAEAIVARVQTAPALRPLKRRYIVALVATNWALAALVWGCAGVALIGFVALLAQQPLLQPVSALWRSTATSFSDVLNLLATTARTFTAQPAMRLAMLAAMAIVAIWLGVLVKVLAPQRRLA